MIDKKQTVITECNYFICVMNEALWCCRPDR